ncbi:MAG: MFS transporter [Phycisphaerales bacterium]|nr:MFS transporter [Phycisphaerales bacterium]
MVPLWALGTLTWLNSLGSGLLWTGAFFVAEHEYKFSRAENLLLAIAASAIYIPAALFSSRLVSWGRGRMGTRGVLSLILVMQSLGATLALAGPAGLVASVLVVSGISALMWPIIESYVSSGRHGRELRTAIGFFNIAWMSAVAVCLILIAPFIAAASGQLAIVAFAPVSLLSIGLLWVFPRDPAPHAPEGEHRHLPAVYHELRKATRFLLPICYMFVGALGPLLPFLLNDREIDAVWQTAFAATWMWARVGIVIVLRPSTFWHGKWSALAVGVLLLAGGFALIVIGRSVPVLAAGFVLFGAGQGALYYASLYYAMAVGGADVEAGGTFEALIGVGYVLGPAAALVGVGLGSSAAIIACVCVVAGTALIPAVRIGIRSRSVVEKAVLKPKS